jgi:hypothetical protein
MSTDEIIYQVWDENNADIRRVLWYAVNQFGRTCNQDVACVPG